METIEQTATILLDSNTLDQTTYSSDISTLQNDSDVILVVNLTKEVVKSIVHNISFTSLISK